MSHFTERHRCTMTAEQYDAHCAAVLATAPPATPEQLQKLAGVLNYDAPQTPRRRAVRHAAPRAKASG
jgi:hypothetical protein